MRVTSAMDGNFASAYFKSTDIGLFTYFPSHIHVIYEKKNFLETLGTVLSICSINFFVAILFLVHKYAGTRTKTELFAMGLIIFLSKTTGEIFFASFCLHKLVVSFGLKIPHHSIIDIENFRQKK